MSEHELLAKLKLLLAVPDKDWSKHKRMNEYYVGIREIYEDLTKHYNAQYNQWVSIHNRLR